MSARVVALSFVACLIAAPGYCGIEAAAIPAAAAEPATAAPRLDPQNIPADRQNVPADAAAFDDAAITAAPPLLAAAPAATVLPVPAPSAGALQLASRDPTEPAAPTKNEPFGLASVGVAAGDVLQKWQKVKADIDANAEILVRCQSGEPCPPAAQGFLAVIAQGRAQSGRARIGVINRAINLAIAPMSDFAQWGVADRWSAPLATLATGRGDCEDYAIAKYVALKEAGVAEDDVRLVIVHDVAIGEDHAIVTARLDGRWIVLDNRRLALVEDVDMHRVVPLFVLDREGVKQFAPATSAHAAAPASMNF